MEREEMNAVLPMELNRTYGEAMRKNLNALMRANLMCQAQLVEQLRQRGLHTSQGNLSMYLSGRKSIPLSVIVHLCDIFQVSLAELTETRIIPEGGRGYEPGGNECRIACGAESDL